MNKNKMLKVFSAICWEPLMVSFAGLFMALVVGKAAIVPFNKDIHKQLGTSDYIEVQDGDAKKIDRHALKDANNIEEYYRQINQEVES